MTAFREFIAFTEMERFAEEILPTSNSAEEEYWSMLKMPHKVQGAGLDLAHRHGISDKQTKAAVLKRYGGFIQQAEANWRAAKHADFHSSPLLYYYCFMNLIKAELVLRDPNMPEKMKHGLAIENKKLPVRFENLESLTQDGIFTEYYKLIYKVNPPPRLKVKDTINYLQEMSFQLFHGNFGKIHAFAYKSRIVMDQTQAWTIFVFPTSLNMSQYGGEFDKFLEEYELVEPPKTINAVYADAFGQKFQHWDRLAIYQSKVPINRNDQAQTIKLLIASNSVFNTHVSENLYKTKDTAVLNLPSTIKFREELSIYVLMFILSSLIRYNPDYMDRVNSKRFGWFLEGFVNVAPTRYLQFMVNRIYSYNFKIDTL